ncbi:PEGA domain-containing protein, partial [Crenothrix polyspora]|uniref:PEGA domain-containing protein n=1 Tax=Crenothrix polyspora TaxID=360316 RepID=UPI00111E3649
PNSSEGTIFGPVFVGKYAYAAPEQINGGEIGAYTDIYSLALVLAEAVLGKKLEMGTSEDSARKARLTVPNLSQIPKELKAQLTAMLHPNPKQRLQSMSDLLKHWPYPPESSKINKFLLLGSVALAASVIGLVLWPSDPINKTNPADINRGYGYLTVHSNPEGALVLANDNHTFIGVTPINKAFIAVGSNNIVIKKNGYSNIEKNIEIKQNSEQALDDIILNKMSATE